MASVLSQVKIPFTGTNFLRGIYKILPKTVQKFRYTLEVKPQLNIILIYVYTIPTGNYR